jgi:hypothetical protein
MIADEKAGRRSIPARSDSAGFFGNLRADSGRDQHDLKKVIRLDRNQRGGFILYQSGDAPGFI